MGRFRSCTRTEGAVIQVYALPAIAVNSVIPARCENCVCVCVCVCVCFVQRSRPLRSHWSTGRAELHYLKSAAKGIAQCFFQDLAGRAVEVEPGYGWRPRQVFSDIHRAFHRLGGAACQSLVPVSGSFGRVAIATMVNPWFHRSEFSRSFDQHCCRSAMLQ